MDSSNDNQAQFDPTPRVVHGSTKTLDEALSVFLPPSGVIKLVREVPDESNDPHRHPNPETLFILEGSLTFTWGESASGTCNPGDRLLLPPNILHSSTAGPEGCYYIITDKYVVSDLAQQVA
jgi:quercetin dioxygenase-like cupin family protein